MVFVMLRTLTRFVLWFMEPSVLAKANARSKPDPKRFMAEFGGLTLQKLHRGVFED